MITTYQTMDGETVRRLRAKSGPKSKGYVSVHAEIPPEYLAVMKARNDECGGLYSVNEQIRRAIYAHILDGLMYINPLIP